MISIRVWNLESDHDTKAAEFLESEFVGVRQLGQLAIRSAGRSALRKCHKRGMPIRESLRRAIQHYFVQDDYIIFVVGADQQKPSPLVDEIRSVVKDCDFSDRVFFMLEVQESELTTPTQWRSVVSRFHTEIESNREGFQEKWDKTMERFHDAFADTPEEEVISDFEEALAEVRRERI